MTYITKAPRVYTDLPLSEGLGIFLEDASHHYLKNVMRASVGDVIRLFNGKDGEFSVRLEKMNKKTIEATVEKKLRAQKNPARRVHLFFAPIKKERMDFLIEKAVELGATDLHPVLTQNTDMRKINEDRLNAQIIEAAEQCERMDIPALHAPEDLFKKLHGWEVPVYAAIERHDAKALRHDDHDCTILIGPSGGFTQSEKEKLAGMKNITPISLGENILRSETAVVAALSLISL